MKRNMNSQAEDGRTAGLAFRSFLDGIILLTLAALLLTLRITPVDHATATGPETGDQPVQASLFPSISSVADPAPAAEKNEPPAKVEAAQKNCEYLVIRLRECSDEVVESIPKVLRPEI